MGERTKELIALGASVSAHCQPCLAYHLGKARELGAGEENIQAAIEAGHMVENGTSAAMAKYVDLVLNQAQCCPSGDSKCFVVEMRWGDQEYVRSRLLKGNVS